MQTAGQAKVTLLLELKNRMKGAFNSANKFLNDNVKGMKDKIRSLKQSHVEAFTAMRNESSHFDRAMSILDNPYTKIIAGVTALVVTYGKASAMAREWDSGMAKANVTAQLSKKDLGKLSDQILEIGARNSGDLMAVPEAFNRIVSAGVETNDALTMLEPTLQAAKAGFADVQTVAMAAVSVMNSSGVRDATRVYDILFATLNKGNAEFSDIAQYLPKIIPMAIQAGISLDETAGAYAYLTAQGMSAEQSATGLQNVFKALSDKQVIFGSGMRKGLKGMGIEVFDAAGKMKPMIDIIDQLQTKMSNLTNEQKVTFLDQIGFDMEAGTAIASMTQDVGKLRSILDFTANSGGQLAQAVENGKTGMEDWQIMGNQVKKTFIEIGHEVNNSFGKLGSILLPVVKGALSVIKDLLIGIWGVVSPILEAFAEMLRFVFDIVDGVTQWLDKMGLLKPVMIGLLVAINPLVGAIAGIVSALNWISNKLGKIFSQDIKDYDSKTLEYMRNDWRFKHNKEMVKAIDTELYNRKYEDFQKSLHPNGTTDEMKAAWGWKKDANGQYVTPGKELMPGGGTTGDGTTPPITPTLTKTPGDTVVSGKAQQVRNITIHIGNLSNVERMNVAGENGKQMSKQEFETYMKEMLTRLLRGVETSYN